MAIGDIAFDPLDPAGNTIFAGTGSASSLANAGGTAIGVFRSTDGGDSWEVFPVNPGSEPQLRVVLPTVFDGDNVTPGVQQVVLVGAVPNFGGPAANTGLYRSIDGGETYTLISGTNGLSNGPVTQIIADPNNSSQYFAGVVGQGVFRSGDGGLNWTAVNTNLTNLGTSTVIQVAAHPGGGTTVLHTLISGGIGTGPGVTPVTSVAFTSNNGGNTWTQLAPIPGPGGFDGSRPDLYTSLASDQLVIDPVIPQIVYIAKGYGNSPILYRYNPGGGGSWTLIDSGGAAGGTRPHVDSRDLKFIGNNILLHANDGGIYFMLNPQAAAANTWASFHGLGATGLGATEYHNVAWDSTFDVTFAGAQDNGTSVQNGVGNVIWTQFQGSDGGDVVVDTVNAGAGQTFRYASTQNLGVLNRYVFDSATNIASGPFNLFPVGGLANFNPPFVPHYELNTADLTRLVTGASGSNPGTSPVYELLNASTAPNPGAAMWQPVPIGAGFVGVNRGTLVYGGRMGGVDNAEVLMAGSGSGVYLRSTAGGMLTATPVPFPGGTVQDIVVDPENWQHFYVADGTGVWETTDAGSTPWNNLSLNLGVVNTRLNSLEFIPTSGLGALVAGGNLGSSKLLLDNLTAQWSRFGAGLPNAVVDELDYDADDDILLAGTFGRGAHVIEDASTVVEDEGILNIVGDEDHVNQDDIITLMRNALNPLILDVFINSVAPVFSVVLALVEQINVFGVGGNDTLIVDSSNGLINVPDGIRYDGDG
ncbi:MAG: sialidase family protein, partial [Thermoguttaceae bacterium]